MYADECVVVCPRKKRSIEEASETQSTSSLPLSSHARERMANNPPVFITRELLEGYFDRPLSVVASELRICQTAVKRVCRKLGIDKWPYNNGDATATWKKKTSQRLEGRGADCEQKEREKLAELQYQELLGPETSTPWRLDWPEEFFMALEGEK
mmetsp:Transcript_23310/g.52352  ORF Transcript_23310/g.52352 Transcript_23310/m.52352 type:complete len:154 (-) Transcript_23310:130-591(-)|eukprot:323272-Hanusia_phi.AAC.2